MLYIGWDESALWGMLQPLLPGHCLPTLKGLPATYSHKGGKSPA